jgi:membrane-bound metal-dependent hydrolase YbcI (DUF457 family)
MTTPEHTLVGIHFAFATGLHRFVGWRGVAMAGVASNIPDWDAIPMLFDMQRFESGHRVWGHGILSIILSSLLIGFIQIRWDWIGCAANWFRSTLPKKANAAAPKNTEWLIGSIGGLVFALIGMCAQLLHLPCDMVVSGGNGLSDWAIQPWWPFSSAAYVYPLIPWGDIGPTVILMAGVIAIAKRNSQLSQTSWLTIVTLCGYLIVRGLIRGTLTV